MQTLNFLQSNAAILQRIRQERGSRANDNIPATERFLAKVGVTLEDLDSLSVIHIAGTQGKTLSEDGCALYPHSIFTELVVGQLAIGEYLPILIEMYFYRIVSRLTDLSSQELFQ